MTDKERIVQLEAALLPFAKFSQVQERIATGTRNNHPREGALYVLQSGSPEEVEISIEHLRAAQTALDMPSLPQPAKAAKAAPKALTP